MLLICKAAIYVEDSLTVHKSFVLRSLIFTQHDRAIEPKRYYWLMVHYTESMKEVKVHTFA